MIIPKTSDKVSYMILQLHFFIMIIPLTSIYAMANLSIEFMMMIVICFGLQIYLIRILPLIKIKKIKNARIIITSILSFLTLLTYFYLLRTQNINIVAFDITSIYEIRSEQKISIGVMAYLITWQYRIINPVLLVISYLKRNYELSFIAIGLQVLLYLMYPHKEVFLSIGLVLMTLFIAKKHYRFDSFFIYFLSLCSIAFAGIYELFKNVLPFAVLPVRLLYVPALIKFQHYEFFLSNRKLYYSEGIIGKILGLNYPYSVSSGFVVSGGGGNANTGYLAYAYDNAGFLGMIFMSLVFVFLLSLIDSLVKNENKNIVLALIVYPMVMLNDNDLLTSLLTGGVFLLIIILFVFNNISYTHNSKEKGL